MLSGCCNQFISLISEAKKHSPKRTQLTYYLRSISISAVHKSIALPANFDSWKSLYWRHIRQDSEGLGGNGTRSRRVAANFFCQQRLQPLRVIFIRGSVLILSITPVLDTMYMITVIGQYKKLELFFFFIQHVHHIHSGS